MYESTSGEKLIKARFDFKRFKAFCIYLLVKLNSDGWEAVIRDKFNWWMTRFALFIYRDCFADMNVVKVFERVCKQVLKINKGFEL